jgi:hypothetical protein
MNRYLAALPAFAMILGPSSAIAQTPPAIADLVGARGAGGETQLEARGYVHIKTEKGDDRAWSNWWHAGRRECVTVAVVDGRFQAITTSPAPDCNQTAGSNHSGAGAAAAAVALTAIGIAALAHQSHHHADGKHLAEAEDGQFERGYRDGLYAQSYHNYDRSNDYSDGYSRGTQRRDGETAYRDGQPRGAGGYAPAAKVNDLLTMRAPSADVALQQRGFRTVNAYQAGETAYTIRANDRTGQCVQVAMTDGRIRYISAINRSACR